MHTDLIETLFGSYHRQLLGLLLLRPDESFHVRELERMTGFPAGTLSRELKRLADAGLLTREHVGNQVRYQANRHCPIYEELAGVFLKTSGLAGVLHKALEPLGNKVELALVFGSLAQGKARAGSDIDLLLLGRVTFREAVSRLSSLHDKLGREINPVVMTRKEFIGGYKSGDRFVTKVWEEPKIFVKGGQDDFTKLGQNWKTRGT